MASKSKVSLVGLFCTVMAFVLLLCFLVMKENPDCVIGYGCYYGGMEKQSRKLLSVKMVIKSSANASATIEEGSELRMAPSGPDPLHHNDNPKKPRTP